MKDNTAAENPEYRFHVQHGSLVALASPLPDSTPFGIVVSNDVQNEFSHSVLVVPLERRISRLNAPFAVDLGRPEGMRELHTARCDWVSRVKREEIQSIERARFSDRVIIRIEDALKIALGFKEAAV